MVPDVTQSRSLPVAIAGGGASGVLVAIQIARQAKFPCRVILYEPRKRLGHGLAYGTNSLHHLLNVPAGGMSAFASEPAHFFESMNSAGSAADLVLGKKAEPVDFVPRALFGRYLASLLEKTYSSANCLATLEVRPEKAVDFIPSDKGGGTVVSADAETDDVSHFVLALGNLPPRDPLNSQHPFFRSTRYIPNAWEAPRLAEKADEDVLIVGSGLTAMDAILSLKEARHRGKIIVTSRGGLFPQPHKRVPPCPDFIANAKWPSTMRGWLRFFRQELERETKRGSDWRAVMDVLRPHTQKIWIGLSLVERRRFLRHLRPFWEAHRHRTPASTWEVVEELRSRGKLEFIHGRIRDFVEAEDGVQVVIDTHGGKGRETPVVERVVNCIGPESNFRQHYNDSLIVNLMARGVVHPDPLLLGLEATLDGHPRGFNGEIFTDLSLIGPPLKGVLWETSAIPEIRVQAERLAARILENLSSPGLEV